MNLTVFESSLSLEKKNSSEGKQNLLNHEEKSDILISTISFLDIIF